MPYIEYNENPRKRKVADCAIRAVAVVTGLGWDSAYKQLANSGFELKCSMCEVEAVDKVLREHGFQVGSIKVSKGSKRPKVAQFAERTPHILCIEGSKPFSGYR